MKKLLRNEGVQAFIASLICILLGIIPLIGTSCPAAAMHEHQYRNFFLVCFRRYKYIHAQLTRRTIVILHIGYDNVPISWLHID